MVASVREIPELKLLNLLKPSEHRRVFGDFFALRQGLQPLTPHPIAQELSSRTGDDYKIVSIERAFVAARSISSSDLPAVLAHAIRYVPMPKFEPVHRKFCKIDPVQDFKDVEYIAGLDDLPVQEAAELEEIHGQPVEFEMPINAKLKHLRTRLTVSRHVWINNQKWLSSAINAMRTALYRKEAALTYAALEAATPAITIPGSNLADVETALENFRALTTSTGELIGAEPKFFICPASNEVAAKIRVKHSGLDIEVIGRSGLTASYLLPDPEQHSSITLQVLDEKGLPLIETNKPDFRGDDVAILDGTHDVNAVFTSGLCVVKLTA
ncbi:hypothetical protein [Methylobacter sp. BlB1]|uniref:phage major capsid protein n=1 Tax=Methylobacter sp. BlB1 TaxID=2785914 RepID=UPI0018943272|nr:hypothetical protein [Methylobacter sp. BlB1]MBF6648947.1 hypothetical protein [Methylobacter sp. BlB1]